MSLRVILLSFFGCCHVVHSQTVSTEILGLITDQTGAVIPGLDVRTTVSNETGTYGFRCSTSASMK